MKSPSGVRPPRRVTRALALALAIALFVAGYSFASALSGAQRSDLDAFFWDASQRVVSGHLLHLYSGSFTSGYPDANGPVGVALLVPFAAVLDWLGKAGDVMVRAAVANAVGAACAVLVAQQFLLAIESGRGRIEWKAATASVVLASPVLWITVNDYGHLEQPIEILFTLLATRAWLARRSYSAGAAIGLAVLSRTSAVLSGVALFAVSLRHRDRTWNGKAAFATLAVVAGGLAPFVAVDAQGIFHSLIGYRGALPIGGGSFWYLLAGSGAGSFAQAADGLLAVCAAIAISAVIVILKPSSTESVAGIFGLITITSCCFPLFAKTVYAYYLLEPFVFGAVWWLARPASAWSWRASVPLLLTASALILSWGRSLSPGPALAADSVSVSAIIAFVIALVVCDSLRAGHGAAHGFANASAVV